MTSAAAAGGGGVGRCVSAAWSDAAVGCGGGGAGPVESDAATSGSGTCVRVCIYLCACVCVYICVRVCARTCISVCVYNQLVRFWSAERRDRSAFPSLPLVDKGPVLGVTEDRRKLSSSRVAVAQVRLANTVRWIMI